MVTECMYGRKKSCRKGVRHTRWFHSGDPVLTARVKKGGKKEKEKEKSERVKKKKKHLPAHQKQKGGELYLPLNEPLYFLSTSCAFFRSYSVHSRFYLCPQSLSIAVMRTPHPPTPQFSPSHHTLPICLTQTCFPGPAIHRYGVHQQ